MNALALLDKSTFSLINRIFLHGLHRPTRPIKLRSTYNFCCNADVPCYPSLAIIYLTSNVSVVYHHVFSLATVVVFPLEERPLNS